MLLARLALFYVRWPSAETSVDIAFASLCSPFSCKVCPSRLSHFKGAVHLTQRGVQTLLVVILLDELFDVRSHVIQVVVLVGADFLPFQRLHEALAARVVILTC